MITRTIAAAPGQDILVHEWGAGRPVLSILGAVHGDELEGVLAARLFGASLTGRDLRGTVRVVPIAHPAAAAAVSRTSPIDGINLARVFPGTVGGTDTERVAAALTERVIAGSDLLVDLHSAGVHYEMPVFVGYFAGHSTGEASEAAARAFGAPVLWHHESIGPGRSLGAAADLGIPSLYVEGSGGSGLRGADIDIYVAGLGRLLYHLGIVVAPQHGDWPAAAPLELTHGDGNTDASMLCHVPGLCLTRTVVNASVREGDVLAEIIDDAGAVAEWVLAPRSGRVMMLRRTAVVRPGDAIVMLAPDSFRDGTL